MYWPPSPRLGWISSLLPKKTRTDTSSNWGNASLQYYLESHTTPPSEITTFGGSYPPILPKKRNTTRCFPLPHVPLYTLSSLMTPLPYSTPMLSLSTNVCGTTSICTNPPNMDVSPSSSMPSKTNGSTISGMTRPSTLMSPPWRSLIISNCVVAGYTRLTLLTSPARRSPNMAMQWASLSTLLCLRTPIKRHSGSNSPSPT